jgi:hypothetical protein
MFHGVGGTPHSWLGNARLNVLNTLQAVNDQWKMKSFFAQKIMGITKQIWYDLDYVESNASNSLSIECFHLLGYSAM